MGNEAFYAAYGEGLIEIVPAACSLTEIGASPSGDVPDKTLSFLVRVERLSVFPGTRQGHVSLHVNSQRTIGLARRSPALINYRSSRKGVPSTILQGLLTVGADSGHSPNKDRKGCTVRRDV